MKVTGLFVSYSLAMEVETSSRLNELLELLARNQEALERITEENKAYYEELAEITKNMKIRKRRTTTTTPGVPEGEEGVGPGPGEGAPLKPTRTRKRLTVPPPPGMNRANSFGHFFKDGDSTPGGKVKIIEEPRPKKTCIDNFEVCNVFDEIEIDPEFVRGCLDKCDVNGDMKLFREIFVKRFTRETLMIRYLGGKNYQYRRAGLWIDDHHGSYLRHVVLKILEKAYMHVNELENYTNNTDQFISNQEHIIGLSDDKYVEKLLNQINQAIDIKR